VLELIRRFNLMSSCVMLRILREKDLAQRAKVLNFFINVAVECQKVQNFNGMMEIVSALYSSPIHRLKVSPVSMFID
jgi:son of sevenless-like protein